MLIINDEDMDKINVSWDELISCIKKTIQIIRDTDYSQPIKTYLKYKNAQNRIIAMPAYVGGEINKSGVKWISSFPQNIFEGKRRANCVVILNDPDTGEINCIITSPQISIYRTAAVSGALIRQYIINEDRNFNVGIIGWGPIGKMHFEMCKAVLGKHMQGVYLYDKYVEISDELSNNYFEVAVCNNWSKVCDKADILITCTSSQEQYISYAFSGGRLILDISLRDFRLETFSSISRPVLVDNWEEVCRENTDIELLYNNNMLHKKDSANICEIMENGFFERFSKEDNIFFAPMGMASFDISIASLLYKKAIDHNIGLKLNN